MLAEQPISPDVLRVNRRSHPRFAASELPGLRHARVKNGREIRVIDLSESGVLFETTAAIESGATLVLEFYGPARTFLIPSRVVRCQTVPPVDDDVRSEAACVFKRRLPLDELVGARNRTWPGRIGQSRRDPSIGRGWQEVVGKCRDGRLVRGYTNDFDPSKAYLHVSSSPLAEQAQFVPMTQLDALFFMRDAGQPGRGELDMEETATAANFGRKVAVTLPNGQELIGSTLGYDRDNTGFFVHLIDTHLGTTRVFVTQSGIRNVRFL